MLRTTILALCLITTGAFASSSELRRVALEQLRAIAEPLFQHGESTAPHFDAFYTDMVESLPPQERAERGLELAINRFSGAADYVTTNAASWSGTIEPTERLTALIRTAVESPLSKCVWPASRRTWPNTAFRKPPNRSTICSRR
jgi:hypothetical protein